MTNSSSNFNRRAFLKTIGAAALSAPFISRNLFAGTSKTVLRHASFGASGMAWSDLTELTKLKSVELVAVADVDLSRTKMVKEKYPNAKIYQDWRVLLDKEGKNLDSVNVSTPDHMHAPIAMTALQMGKNVYCQKPLAHDLYEVRRLTEMAKSKKVVTQMGIQIHSTNHYRQAARLVQMGVIGKVKEVHSWCPKSWGDPEARPTRSDPVPETLDWDIWLGVCGTRPFIGDAYYHPANWRKRLDFGTGTFGDMGCHIFDPVFMAIGLGSPISVRSEGPEPNQWNWAIDSKIHYTFPGTLLTAAETLPVTWYDGDSKPPADVVALLEGDERPHSGSMVVGTEGTMVIPHINRPVLYPDKKFKDFKYPDVKGDDHWVLFAQACLGGYPTSASFSYAGPLTEAVLLGGVASRFRQTTLKWDGKKQKFDLAEANQFIKRAYRKGWSVKGLS